VDVEEAFDFEPLGAIFPEFGGARFVGGVFVDFVMYQLGMVGIRGLRTLIFQDTDVSFASR
jgi:hypothetical protein